jgi:transposase-like protein
MKPMTDFLDVTLNEIRDRVKELRPLVDEFHRLEAAERALSGLDAGATVGRGSSDRDAGPMKGARKRPESADRGRLKGSTGGSRRGRPKGSGSRATQALEFVRKRPGITIAELAEEMGIQQNYLYRVMPDLAERRLVDKSGRGWHAREEPGDTATGDQGETTSVASEEAEPAVVSASGAVEGSENAASDSDAVG